ncbi:MAG: hypothetical protein K2K24_05195, partial [Clostridia bacterium]|nr:hypothetical protein [Clostridia bacterium]
FMQFSREVLEMMYDLIMIPFYAASGIMLWGKMLFKCIFDRKKLLEWKTFYSSQRQNNYSKHIQMLLPSIILCIILGGIFYSNIYLLVYFAMYIIVSNLIYLTSKSVDTAKEISKEDKDFLLDIASRTCKYFESNLKNKSLICDNYQVFPKKEANGFTSPTNMGFAILSYICSYKIGNITLDECMQKLEEQITITESLEKYKGHLFN